MKTSNNVIIVKKLETKITDSGDLIAEYDLREIIKSYDKYTILHEDVSIQVSGSEIFMILDGKLKTAPRRPHYSLSV